MREDVKMSRCERRCEDEKMFYRPPLLEEPCAQTLSGISKKKKQQVESPFFFGANEKPSHHQLPPAQEPIPPGWQLTMPQADWEKLASLSDARGLVGIKPPWDEQTSIHFDLYCFLLA